MAPQELEGVTLAHKHRNYNKLFREQITPKRKPEDIKVEDNDVNNLLKIDLASVNKDVEYTLNVLQSDDLLYVSKVLAKCSWLVTDQNYANIINPNYLQTVLFPKMTTKAIVKLKKHIRHHIKDETRAEMFYLNEKNKDEAIKWLPQCSVDFIENNIKNHNIDSYENPMKLRLFKRLCEKSVTIFEIIMKELSYVQRLGHLQVASFIMHTDVDKYLQVIEDNDFCSNLSGSTTNRRLTRLIMKQSRNRVIDKIEKYVSIIHLPTFVKYLGVDDIKTFLYSQAKKDSKILQATRLKTLFYCDNLKHFIKKLPTNEQYDFVKNACMLKEIEDDVNLTAEVDTLAMRRICRVYNEQSHVWYQFAPFDIAFEEITKLITLTENTYEKQNLFRFLVKCTDRNLQHVQMVLKYFISNHMNEEASYKFQCVAKVLEQINIAKCDGNTWHLLNDVFKLLKIYDASSDITSNYTEIVNYIIIYNTIHNLKSPGVIEKLFVFSTLKSYRNSMNQEQQNKLFIYLYEYLLPELKKTVTNEKDFTEYVETTTNILILLRDWNKPLLDYPIVLQKIREIIDLKKANSYKKNLVSLYNVKKSWRKLMFEESVNLCPNEEVCLNALKHEPELLERHNDTVETLRTDGKVSMPRLLTKLRMYWPHTYAQQWTVSYFNKISETNSENAVTRGLCLMLPQKQLLDIIEKYKPSSPKIDWKQTDQNVLNVQRALAKNMHRARPQPTPDAILSYAVGDYLQFALPSLIAIFYNLKYPALQQYILKLLDAPVSVQKHGIRVAFEKLDREQFMKISLNCWQTSKNVSIRAIIFKYTFALLCAEKDPIHAVSLWNFLKLLMDELTYTENKDVYTLLYQVQKVPTIVKANFLIKSYEFLKILVTKVDENDRSDYKNYCDQLIAYSSQLIEDIDPSFVINIIEEFLKNNFFESDDGTSDFHFDAIIGVISMYILCSPNEEVQIQKYENILEPLLQSALKKWSIQCNGNYFIRKNTQKLLKRLFCDLKYVVEKNKVTPVQMYSRIQLELKKSLSVPENYLLLNNLYLTVALVKLLHEYSPTGEDWTEKIAYDFGNICLSILKHDVTLHFPSIYVLFSKSVKFIINQLMTKSAILKFYEAMLSDPDFVYAYLSFIEIEEQNRSDKDQTNLWARILSHPSIEIKMHYYNKIKERI